MKKVVFITATMLLTGSVITGVYGTVNTRVNTIQLSVQDSIKKEKITEDQLPQPVKNVLAGQEYKGWKPESIYLIKNTKEYYQVTLKMDSNVKVINLDKEGNVVKE